MVSFLHRLIMVPAAIAMIVATTTLVTAFTTTTTPHQQTRISKTVVHATKSNNESSTRRDVINKVFTASLLTITSLASSSVSSPSNALDIDSFENSLLEQDTTQCNPKLDPKCIPKLTPDEALCKYGVPGADARTDACKRVRDAGGQLPTSKTGERSTQGWLNGDIALTR